MTRKVLTCMENVCVCIEDYVRQDNKCVNEGKWKQIYLFYLFYIFIMFFLGSRFDILPILLIMIVSIVLFRQN